MSRRVKPALSMAERLPGKLAALADEALRLGAAEVKRIAPRSVVTAEWVRRKCQYGCDMYGQCLTCPPYSPSPEETRRLLDGYREALLIRVGERAKSLRQLIAALERSAFLSGCYQAFGMASGPCRLCGGSCPPLAAGEKKGCRHPEEARPSMEACGIDVFATVRASGLRLEVIRSEQETPRFYGLLLCE